jgi:hypothetical protein
MPAISALRNKRQEDGETEASLSYIARPCIKKQRRRRRRRRRMDEFVA